MKKIGFIFLCSVILGGCVFLPEIKQDVVLEKNELVTESPLPYEKEETDLKAQEAEGHKDGNEETSLESSGEENREFTDELKAEMMRKQQELYYFSNLEITQQNLYVEILYALENYIEGMKVSTTDTDQIDKVFQCVLMDHPEIFYTDGYSFVKYTLGEDVKKIVFKGTYIYDREEKESKEQQIEKAALNMLTKLDADATDYEKVKYVYEAVIHNTEYDMEAEDNQNICSVFLNNASVCQGYAKAVQYLLTKLNVPATLVIGTVETGEGHAWNLVKVNNEFYYVDATWGDASYLLHLNEESQEIQNTPAISYDYLCITTEELNRTHRPGDMVPLPVCDSLDANYYVREGAYFTDVNYDQLAQLMEQYTAEGRESVTLRCATDLVYQEMWQELLSEQKIFKYLNGTDNSIMYTDSPKQRSITFWL